MFCVCASVLVCLMSCLKSALLFVQVEKMEKERMKRVVLNIHERQEEEDYQGCY